jgi:hypothetical protein
MNGSNKFEYTSKLKTTFLGVLSAGVVLTVIGMLTGASMDRFWSNYLLDTILFLGISVLAIFFLTAHQIAMSGWHIMVKRVPEAMSQFTLFGAGFMLVVIIGLWGGFHNLYAHWDNDFVTNEMVTLEELKHYEEHHGDHGGHAVDYSRTWQDFQYDGKAEAHAEEHHAEEHKVELVADENGKVENPHYDKLIAGKEPYLNKFAWTLRSIIYLSLWVFIAITLRRLSKREDLEGTNHWFMRTKFWSAIFLIIWAVSSSMMAWDWVMSLDPHWYSTLFGWYNFVSLWIASLCTIVLILIYLKRKGYLSELNENHLHDLGKYIFGFSVFWTYLWFSQFMLYWYGNIPEETRWWLDRARTNYKWIFYANLLINFLFPFLTLLRRDAKRNLNVLTIVASVLILSHWLDFFLMIMPPTVGSGWGIGALEIGMFLTYAGLFLYIVFGELAKASLVPEKHPLYRESLDHHI